MSGTQGLCTDVVANALCKDGHNNTPIPYAQVQCDLNTPPSQVNLFLHLLELVWACDSIGQWNITEGTLPNLDRGFSSQAALVPPFGSHLPSVLCYDRHVLRSPRHMEKPWGDNPMERQGSWGTLGTKHESQKPSWALSLVQLGDNHLNALAQENLRRTRSWEPREIKMNRYSLASALERCVMQQEMIRTEVVCYFYHHLSFYFMQDPCC